MAIRPVYSKLVLPSRKSLEIISNIAIYVMLLAIYVMLLTLYVTLLAIYDGYEIIHFLLASSALLSLEPVS